MTITVNCRDSMPAIHDQLSEALGFPDWYGRNLDALHDCLTEVSFDVEFRLLEPSLHPGLHRVLQDSAGENPHITLAE